VNALVAVVPPLMASTTSMPLALVSAPGPPALVMRNAVLPVAVPPLMTSMSEAEPSPPRYVLSATTLLAPPT
jgi:hypothetical protein